MTKKRTPRNKDVQGFEYIESESILHGLRDEYSLSREEHYILYSFYVEHSMYGDQSNRKRTFMDYGWDSNETTKNGAKEALCKVLLGKAEKSLLINIWLSVQIDCRQRYLKRKRRSIVRL